MNEQTTIQQAQQTQEPIAKKLILTRDKHIIYIKRSDTGEILRFNLREKRMEKFDKGWKPVRQQYKFFSNFYLSDIECKEEKFLELIRKSKRMNPHCRNVSSFIARLEEALVYENYEVQGIDAELDIRDYGRRYFKNIITKPIEFYHKNVISFFKKYKVTVNKDIENSFIQDYNLMEQVIYALENSNISKEEKKDFFLDAVHKNYNIKSLVDNYKYDLSTLLKYLFGYLKPFENLEPRESIGILDDYMRMATKIGRDVKKYPKYLRSMHDIITSNYEAFKRDYSEIAFRKTMREDLEIEGTEYCVIVPKTPNEILAEGVNNSNCVGSYMQRIIDGETYLFFLRLTKEKDKSLVTLELRDNKIVQAKGAYNRPIDEKEKAFVESYCKKKEIALCL